MLPAMKTKLLEDPSAGSIKDIACQIWLAGLGAYAKAQEEGGKFFEALVQDGQAMDARMRKTVEREEPIRHEIKAIKGRAEEIHGKAAGAWNKLEDVFQARVARALCRLGVPSRDDIEYLFKQVELLGQNVQALSQVVEAEAKPQKTRAAKPIKPVEPTIID